MFESLQAAIVVTICLLLLMSIFVRLGKFTLYHDQQAVHFKQVNDLMQKSDHLYTVQTLSWEKETTPYVIASPLTMLVGLRLVEDLYHLENRRETTYYDPLPALPQPGQPLPLPNPTNRPWLPGGEPTPLLPPVGNRG